MVATHLRDSLGFAAKDFRRWLVVLVLLVGSSSQAFAGIQFCNEFNHPVRFAIAFEAPEGWVSEGWLAVDPKACADTKYENLTEFYWSGETDWYGIGGGKRQQTTWGKGRQFSVKDKSFALKNADRQLKGARFAGFSGPITIKIPSAVMVAIEAEGGSMVVTTPINPLKSDPDYKTCEKSSGDEAIAACDRAIGSGKFSGHLLAALHVNRGVERKRKNDLDGALSDYSDAIRIDAKLALAYKNRGRVHFAKGDYDAAIRDFDQAIQLDPDDFANYAKRGDAYRKKGDRDRAIADYNKALSLKPDDDNKQAIEAALNELGSGAPGSTSTSAPPAPTTSENQNATPSSGSAALDNAPGAPDPASPSNGPGTPAAGHNYMDEITEWNVLPQTVLQQKIASRTPTTLPGARRITTDELRQTAAQYLLIDVLDADGPHSTIPGAVHLPGAGDYGRGRFDDKLQKKLTKVLADLTKSNLNQPIVFFCAGSECWESYNAALRAINMGYRNVLWYRGGTQSWKAAQFPTAEPAATYPVR